MTGEKRLANLLIATWQHDHRGKLTKGRQSVAFVGAALLGALQHALLGEHLAQCCDDVGNDLGCGHGTILTRGPNATHAGANADGARASARLAPGRPASAVGLWRCRRSPCRKPTSSAGGR